MNRVLIIEDDRTALRQVSQLFTFEGFTVDEAASGQDGIERALKQPPDLIVCDIMMPGTDGFGVLEALRKTTETSLIPFIFLTAKAGMQDVRVGMSEGADDYITKPFEAEALMASARQRLARRRLQIEEAERLATGTGMLAAATVPLEMERSLAHIERVSDALVSRFQADDQLTEMRTAIRTEVSHLRRMSQRLSLYGELPRLYAGRFSDHDALGRCSVEMINDAARTAAAENDRLGDLTVELNNGVIPIPMTGDAIALLTYELVTNACKFSPSNTRIELTATLEDAFWRLTVADYGHGMLPSQIAAVGAFKQFWSGSDRPPGLGLGLVLVQALVRLHSGEICIESEAEQGTRVAVMLPSESMR